MQIQGVKCIYTKYAMIKIYNENCIDVLQRIETESIDLLVTDPPYCISTGGGGGMHGILSPQNKKVGKIFKHNDIDFSDWIPEVYRVLKQNTHAYIMTNPRNLMRLQAECEKAGFTFQNLLVWDKGNVNPTRCYMNAYELILMLRKGNEKKIYNCGEKTLLGFQT